MKRISIAMLVLINLLLLFVRMYWCVMFPIAVAVFVVLYNSKLKPAIWLRKYSVVSTVSLFLFVFVLAVFVKVFIAGIYSIPSSSMEDTLQPGDKIVVSKVHYGPRLPRSPFEVSWVNILFYLNKNARTKIDSNWYAYRRLSGFSKIKRDDIIVFDFPGKCDRVSHIKRCVGLPGDRVELKVGVLFRNNREIIPPLLSKALYRVRTNNVNILNKLCESEKKPVLRINGGKLCEIALNQRELSEFRNTKNIESIVYSDIKPDSIPLAYPNKKEFLWTPDNFGPLVVPKKDMTIELTEENFLLYKDIINSYENQNIYRNEDGIIKLNSVSITHYTFTHNYYFMMGDYRHNSIDSRIWGFLPEEGIIGKATLIFYNYKSGKFSWNRVFKRIK